MVNETPPTPPPADPEVTPDPDASTEPRTSQQGVSGPALSIILGRGQYGRDLSTRTGWRR